MFFRIKGPKGGAVVNSTNQGRLVSILPGLIKRFKKVSVSQVPVAPVPATPLSGVRELIVKWAQWGVQNEPSIHYAEIRPMPLSEHLPMTTDCSGFATLCYKLAGAADPNGLHYNGQGYTGTLLTHGKKVAKPRVGDLVVYGGGTGHHVAVVVQTGADPLTVSHGQERGPFLITVSEEKKYQPPGVTFLSFLP